MDNCFYVLDDQPSVQKHWKETEKWPLNQRMCIGYCVSGVGTVFRLKGAVLHLSFIDVNGMLIPPVAEPWKDASRSDDASATKDKNSCNSTLLSPVAFRV